MANNGPQPLLGEYSTEEAAEILGVHPKTLIDWVRAGRVRAIRTPGGNHRFRRVDLDEFARSLLTRPEAS